MIEKSFHQIEQEAWSERAGHYNAVFSPVAAQAIGDILDGLGALEGRRHLDVACGTGHLVAAAIKRGAISEGIDFAQPMIEIARAAYPQACFQVADAACLPYDDQSFDAVTCSFGLSHMANPKAAVTEAFRVLKSGGRFAFTLWFGAEEGNAFHKIIDEALAAYATTTLALPEKWTPLRLANQQACEAISRQAGFDGLVFQKLPTVWQMASAQDVAAIVDRLSIRTKMIIESQPPAVQQQIRQYILAQAEAHRKNGVISLAGPALLTVGQKPY